VGPHPVDPGLAKETVSADHQPTKSRRTKLRRSPDSIREPLFLFDFDVLTARQPIRSEIPQSPKSQTPPPGFWKPPPTLSRIFDSHTSILRKFPQDLQCALRRTCRHFHLAQRRLLSTGPLLQRDTGWLADPLHVKGPVRRWFGDLLAKRSQRRCGRRFPRHPDHLRPLPCCGEAGRSQLSSSCF